MFQAKQALSARINPLTFERISTGLTSLVLAFYIELFHEAAVLERKGSASGILFGTPTFSSFWHIALLISIFLILFKFLKMKKYKYINIMLHHRILIGCIIVSVCTFFKLSGSSVAQWSNYLGGQSFQGTLAGIPRSIRSDEWAVLTPFAFSQSNTGYASISGLLRASATDVSMIYAQPCWTIATLFHPFLWGYLLFGSTHGLAFFWSARLICLILISYQFGLRITRNNQWLAILYAALIAFAPIIQWWFAVNSIAELFIAGQGLVLSLDKYLHASSYKAHWKWGVILAYLVGMYALALYPAWQIGLFYVFTAMGIWIIYDWKKQDLIHTTQEKRFGHKTLFFHYIMPILIPIITVISILIIIIYQSWATITTILNTSYPGARLETGGGMLSMLFNGGASLFSALDADYVLPNAPEQATFFSLFPVGLILSVITLYKKHDSFTLITLIIYIFLLIYGIFGFPTWLSKLVDRFRTRMAFC
jgi:hypothetical protein